MKQNQVHIILPGKLYFLRGEENSYAPYGDCSPHGREEYHLYYKNFVYPYSDQLDVFVTCEYGTKYTTRWSFDGVCEKDSFPLEMKVYSPYGELLAEKTVTVYMVSTERKPFNILCIGDSMTRTGTYITRMAFRLPSVSTLGIRRYDGEHYCEGRGGWHSMHYLEKYTGVGISPFLFPESVSGEAYLGDVEHWKRVREVPGEYDCVAMSEVAEFYQLNEFDEAGFPAHAKEGDVVYHDGFCRKQGNEWVKFEDKVSFDFSKYISRYQPYFQGKTPDCVSILLGANDFYFTSYEDIENKINEVIARYQEMLRSVKAYRKDMKIILNLPVLGAGFYCGETAPVDNTVKRYCHHVLEFCEKIIETWDNEEAIANGIYISPMMNCLDMENGFEKSYITRHKYTEAKDLLYGNWVHPNRNGYQQMGDVLAGVVGYLMTK